MTTVTDQRDLGAFIPAELDDYGLDPWEFRVYTRIVRRAGGGSKMTESAANVAAQTGMGERKVREAFRLLRLAGLVTVTKRPGETDEYRLTPASKWADRGRLDELRTRAKRPDHRTDDPVDNPADHPQDPGRTDRGPTDRGPRDRPPRSHRPDTAVGPTDEGTPGKVLPEGPPPPARARDRLQPVDGGGGGDEPDDQVYGPHLEAIVRRLATGDADLPARLLGDDRQLHRLATVLHTMAAEGWDPDRLAAAVTRGPLDDAISVAAVLEDRMYRLRRGHAQLPDHLTRNAPAQVPTLVLAELDRQAVTEAFDDAGSIDPDVRRTRLDELVADWLATHTEPAAS